MHIVYYFTRKQKWNFLPHLHWLIRDGKSSRIRPYASTTSYDIQGRTFMLTVLARLTLWKKTRKSLSQLVDCYAHGERNNANNVWLADAFYLIGSAVFQCMEYHWTTKVRQKTLFFVFFRSVSRTNTVNMNAPPLVFNIVNYAFFFISRNKDKWT
jgi:hypothetical protein